MTFGRDGARRARSVIRAEVLRGIEAAVGDVPPDQACSRLFGIDALQPILASSGSVGRVAVSVLGETCRPVRAILFDKTPATNWSLAWHQDRTIAVEQRIEVEGFGPWTVKDGLLHVAPPFEVLAGMVTLRVHLDPVPATNAPLLIAPGSHRLGRIPERDVPDVVRRCGTVACLADAGDVWLYALRSCTPRRQRSSRVTAGSCRWITRQASYPAASNGLASESRTESPTTAGKLCG